MAADERKRHEATITIGEFLLLRLAVFLSTCLFSSRQKASWLIFPAGMTLRGQVVSGIRGCFREDRCLYTECTPRSGSPDYGDDVGGLLVRAVNKCTLTREGRQTNPSSSFASLRRCRLPRRREGR